MLPAASATSGNTASLAEGAIRSPRNPGSKLWDYAAIKLIVEEAGGRCTTFEGTEPSPGLLDFSPTGPLHELAISLRAEPASPPAPKAGSDPFTFGTPEGQGAD